MRPLFLDAPAAHTRTQRVSNSGFANSGAAIERFKRRTTWRDWAMRAGALAVCVAAAAIWRLA